MKRLILIITGLLMLDYYASAQLSIGAVAGISPNVNPKTRYIIVNKQEPHNEFTFNVGNVIYNNQIGLVVRYDNDPFWFMLECIYGGSETEYVIQYTDGNNGLREAPMLLKEEQTFLNIPVSVGFRQGIFEIFSGLTLTRDLERTTEMETMPGYTSDIPSMHIEWHSGVGVNYKYFFAHVRYQQGFANYGADRYVNGNELALYNVPGRVSFNVGIKF